MVFGLAVIAGLYICSKYNYPLFHTIAEIFGIIVACGMFMVVWNSRQFLANKYLEFLGVAYLFIGPFFSFSFQLWHRQTRGKQNETNFGNRRQLSLSPDAKGHA